MDNLYLKTELKASNSDQRISKAQFEYGMVLVGLALLHQHKISQPTIDDSNDQEIVPIEDQIEKISSAMATIILPAINALGALNLSDIEESTASGEAP